MKLILREYLASLRERNELDALLPDLLSQMGLDVFSKPGTGGRQYGVDVAAFGAIDAGPKKVYLFSVKAGDLGRKDWNSGSVQDLQPSLDEIRTVYIANHLPQEYQAFPVEICICFGGDLKEEVALNISSYEKIHSSDTLSFSRWGGERLSNLIEAYFLKEELVPKKCRSLMRKSLAMLDEPDVASVFFGRLVRSLCDAQSAEAKDILTIVRQLHLCVWIQYSWCRAADNVESAYRGCEIALLNAWSISRPLFGQKNKAAMGIYETLDSIQSLLIQIQEYFFREKILPHVGRLHALSSAVNPSCATDVNLKLFDILGRISLSGIWLYWYFQSIPVEASTVDVRGELSKRIEEYFSAIKSTINTNPTLLSPYKDDQAIDIAIALWFLALDQRNKPDIQVWLANMVGKIDFLFAVNSQYPSNITSYHELIEHPKQDTNEYRESVTKGSILYPYISIFASLLEFGDVYAQVQSIKKKYLEKCNFQIWFPGDDTEEFFYNNREVHGGTLSDVPIDKDKKIFLQEVFDECEQSQKFRELSAITRQFWPLIITACRHYRIPFPVHFIYDIASKYDGKE